jgi:uncharacterized protein
MAKAPLPGYAKTRLIPALGAHAAAALAERLLDNAVTQAVAAKLGRVDLCCTPDSSHPAFLRQRKHIGLELSNQGEGDLGARMSCAFDRWLARQRCALLIGTDAPALDAAMLRTAAEALTSYDAVFIPALDGGYALVGLSRRAPQLFNDMRWSTSEVMAHTRERLFAHQLRYLELPALADIDEQADFVHLPAGWLV